MQAVTKALFEKFVQGPIIFLVVHHSCVVSLQAIVQDGKPNNSAFQPAEKGQGKQGRMPLTFKNTVQKMCISLALNVICITYS